MISTEDVVMTRYVIHKIIIPLVFTVGLIGNSLSIVVLTRKRMRCSSNIYLAGLAITDLLYLTMSLVMSLAHYDNMHRYKLYWSMAGIFHWLIDSFSYISTYIVVSFTIERYIAICYPIKGQTLCTESRAKKVIGITATIIMLSIISTAFEYQIIESKKYVDRDSGEICHIPQNFTTVSNVTVLAEDELGPFSRKNKESVGKHLQTDHTRGINKNRNNGKEMVVSNLIRNSTLYQNETKPQLEDKCHFIDYYRYGNSELANKPSYTFFYYTTAIIYSIIPLLILVTFNTFLILAVRKSNKLRKDMTNNVNSRQTKQKISSITQENRITIILIAVVILFIICQLPWATLTVLTYVTTLDQNLMKFLSNIANLLVGINAASNFFLYCLLSDKYRRTVKELIMGYKYKRQDTMSSSYLQRTITPKRSSSGKIPYKAEILKDDRKRLPSIQETAPTNNEYRPASFGATDKKRKSIIRKDSTVSARITDENNTKPLLSEQILKPNEGESNHSLTRSQSLEFKPKIKHSPDCKEFPNDLCNH